MIDVYAGSTLNAPTFHLITIRSKIGYASNVGQVRNKLQKMSLLYKTVFFKATNIITTLLIGTYQQPRTQGILFLTDQKETQCLGNEANISNQKI